MKTDLKAPILAILGLASLAVAIPMSIANAQQPPDQAQGVDQARRTQGNPPGGFQGGPPQDFRPDGGQRMGMLGGGPATMVTDNAFLFILQGNTIYKVNKNNLEVVGTGNLPMPGPFMGGPGGPGAGPGGPGGPGVRGGGGAGGGATQRTSGGDEGAK